jgi:hypothetical protein
VVDTPAAVDILAADTPAAVDIPEAADSIAADTDPAAGRPADSLVEDRRLVAVVLSVAIVATPVAVLAIAVLAVRSSLPHPRRTDILNRRAALPSHTWGRSR